MSVFCKFADYKKIIDLKTLIDKKIDEKKQGNVLTIENQIVGTKKLYIESYGCQMNFSDSEIVASILNKENYSNTEINIMNQLNYFLFRAQKQYLIFLFSY